MNFYTVWACDHLWERYDGKDLAVRSQIHGMCHSQACDSYHDTGLVIPVCTDCLLKNEHVVVSCRHIPHPFDDDAWADVGVYEDQQWELEKEQEDREATAG